ncbi:polysaccharide ABC efflux pump, ATPase subunit [Cupriavidus sp. HMR-1]|uniref:ABC transporter ATP-binding protein n=1 Tax=Cupriavidus sp. HMR-1 TaxID=1249621 RepID=UPI0002A1B725|nr:ABC transporter ATP-binding protein [Cupriavidus sp. HMR-1]EKZ95730.1 polysaccharide ABC efflux pump, ATPase subunit [Cupriavidus sp. HMR-1]
MSSEPHSAMAPPRQIAISAAGLSKRYIVYASPLERLKQLIVPSSKGRQQEFWALKDLNMTIHRGETVAIIGQNGSGKSTLLQILCGTLGGTSGAIEVNGRVAALLELGAGFNADFTGRENVYLNGAVLGLSRSEIDSRFHSIEAFAEIGAFIDQPVKTYSSGMYVRLAFAVAIHVDPQILIIDEALAVGDSRFQAKCLRRIKEMQANGVTILFVSHDVAAVRTLCERAIWLDHGRIRMSGGAFAVTAQYNQFLFENESLPPRQAEGKITSIDEPGEVAKPSSPAETPDSAAGSVPDVAAVTLASVDDDAKMQMAMHRPINHWGSHVGSIIEAGIFNARGERAETLLDREEIEVRVRVRPPPSADRCTLSVAFSMKDLSGTDLIVSTTWDQQSIDFTRAGDEMQVRFRFRNHLNTGKYLLAVALEDRASIYPQYYEYIEGAHYFGSMINNKVYGNFLVDVEQDIDMAQVEKRAAA